MSDLQQNTWPFYGYAPGNYMCRCLTCQSTFQGDKRAYDCLECAVKRSRALTAPQLHQHGGGVTDEMVEAALNACPLNYFQPRGDGNGYVSCSANTADIRLMLTAALAHQPLSVQVLTEAQQQAQEALDKVMNCRFSNFDAGAVIHWVERGMYQLKLPAVPKNVGGEE